jgi:hydrogenase nickel incorporation protein HypA/HybF
MHELAISEAIVTGVCEQVGDVKVSRVVLEIGRLAAVVPDAVRFCFDLSAHGTAVEGAELEIIEIPGMAHCRECAADVELEDSLVAPCQRCGAWNLDIVSGQELRIKYVEVV